MRPAEGADRANKEILFFSNKQMLSFGPVRRDNRSAFFFRLRRSEKIGDGRNPSLEFLCERRPTLLVGALHLAWRSHMEGGEPLEF